MTSRLDMGFKYWTASIDCCPRTSTILTVQHAAIALRNDKVFTGTATGYLARYDSVVDFLDTIAGAKARGEASGRFAGARDAHYT